LASLALLLALGPVPIARAQRLVQVVTRTIEQQLPCPANGLVRIRAEKATVRVQGWDQPTVRLVMRLIAKHAERAVAEQELPVARYQFAARGSTIDVVNFFAVAAGASALRSDLRAEYTLWVPASAAVELHNVYGHTTLAGLSGRQSVTQEFGPIVLNKLRGALEVKAKYADLTGHDTNLTFSCEADKSAIQLTQADGTYAIRNTYGSVLVEPGEELKSLYIEAERSEVKIGVARLDRYNYRFGNTHGPLVLPASMSAAQTKSLGRNTLNVVNKARLPLLRVYTSFAPITLQATPLVVQP
jgi:hypothetical protein